MPVFMLMRCGGTVGILAVAATHCPQPLRGVGSTLLLAGRGLVTLTWCIVLPCLPVNSTVTIQTSTFKQTLLHLCLNFASMFEQTFPITTDIMI